MGIVFQNLQKYVATICVAPQVLSKADIIKGKEVTSYPTDEFRNVLSEAKYLEN